MKLDHEADYFRKYNVFVKVLVIRFSFLKRKKYLQFYFTNVSLKRFYLKNIELFNKTNISKYLLGPSLIHHCLKG